MLVGHINLAPSYHTFGEHFVSLIDALGRAGVEQHVLVSNPSLAQRTGAIRNVTTGPVVNSAVTAYCLMPRVDVAHVHETTAGQAGLLLALTRSVPYVLTHRGMTVTGGNPLQQAVYRRAAAVICRDDSDVALLRHWLPGLLTEVIPDIEYDGLAEAHLRLYQNSQRMPMAGSKGIQ